ncbi:MAG: chalcone isomerase family protein [Rubrivivax sp.]|nr:chalcone isomerase family protein [Rubrivivax sp.]
MKTLSRRRLLLGATLLAATGARAQSPAATGVPPELTGALTGARLQGAATLRFFGLRVYDARLWVGGPPPGADWVASPFALELQYARSLKGEQIAERSLVEMRRQGAIADAVAERWLGNMKQLFPDVDAGHRITGLNLPGTGARFFVNGSPRGEPREVDFARMFFGIWLSPRTSEPAMREQLLGLKAS